MPRVSNSVATGITSDLAAECDLKAFYDRNYVFTIFPIHRVSPFFVAFEDILPESQSLQRVLVPAIRERSCEVCMHSRLHSDALSRFA